MALALVQRVESFTNPAVGAMSSTFSSTPVVGNVLVAYAITAGDLGVNAGWTQIALLTGTLSTGYGYGSAYRVVVAGDTATVSPFSKAATALETPYAVAEISGQAATAFIFAHAESTTATAGTSTIAGATPSSAGMLALSVAAGAKNTGTNETVSNDSSLVQDSYTISTTGSTFPECVYYGHKTQPSGTAFAPTFTWLNTNNANVPPTQLYVIIAPAGGGTVKTASLTAILSFVGASIKVTNRAQAASLAFSGAVTKRVSRALASASLTFSGAVTTAKLKAAAFVAGLSFVGAQSKTTSRAQTAALSFVGAIAKQTTRAQTAALSFVGAQSKLISRALTAALSFVGTFVASKNASLKTAVFTAGLSFVGAQSKTISRAQTAALSFVGAQTKAIARAYNASLALSGGFVKSTMRAISAGVAFGGSITSVRVRGILLTATLALGGTQSKAISRGLTASLTLAGGISRGFRRAFVAVLAFVGLQAPSKYVAPTVIERIIVPAPLTPKCALQAPFTPKCVIQAPFVPVLILQEPL